MSVKTEIKNCTRCDAAFVFSERYRETLCSSCKAALLIRLVEFEIAYRVGNQEKSNEAG